MPKKQQSQHVQAIVAGSPGFPKKYELTLGTRLGGDTLNSCFSRCFGCFLLCNESLSRIWLPFPIPTLMMLKSGKKRVGERLFGFQHVSAKFKEIFLLIWGSVYLNSHSWNWRVRVTTSPKNSTPHTPIKQAFLRDQRINHQELRPDFLGSMPPVSWWFQQKSHLRCADELGLAWPRFLERVPKIILSQMVIYKAHLLLVQKQKSPYSKPNPREGISDVSSFVHR